MDRAISRLLVVFVTALLTACGAGAPKQNRPRVVGFYPAANATTLSSVGDIRIVYDEPVTILNPYDVLVYANNFFIPVDVTQRANDPNAIYATPVTGYFFAAETTIVIHVNEGAVINGSSHYADTPYISRFDTGPEPDVPVGHPGAVTMLDPHAYTATVTRATPAGREAVGLIATVAETSRRVWCQLDHGAATGMALAYFDPTDPAATPMDVIDLSGAGDLTAGTDCITVDLFADFVYAAYRNEASGRIRVFKIDVATGLEVDAFDIQSVPAGPATAPVELILDETGQRLVISCEDAATGTLAYVTLPAFVEEDRDLTLPGIQGDTIPSGAGPIAPILLSTAIAHPANSDMTFMTQVVRDTTTYASPLVGTSVDILRTRDANVLLHTLAGFAGGEALYARLYGDIYSVAYPVVISDDIGGASTGATSSLDMVSLSAESRYLLLLAAPAGPILTSWSYGGAGFAQDDLDDVTAGVQAYDIDAVVPGAAVLGRSIVEFAPVGP